MGEIGGARRRPGDRHLRQPAHGGSGGDRRHDRRRRARTGAPKLAAASSRRPTRGYHAEVDRRAAIRSRPGGAPGDVLLIAGKGHEDYQIVGTHQAPLRRPRRGGGRAGAGVMTASARSSGARAPRRSNGRRARWAARSCRRGRAARHFAGAADRQPRGRAGPALLRGPGRARRRLRLRGAGGRRRRGRRRRGARARGAPAGATAPR